MLAPVAPTCAPASDGARRPDGPSREVPGVVASVTGDPAVFVSVAAVHQGRPPGGGPVIAIVDQGA